LSAIEAVRFNRVANSIRMDLKFTGNRADLPVFAKEQMTDLHAGLCADHRDILKPWDFGKRIDELTTPATSDTTKKGRTLFVQLLPPHRQGPLERKCGYRGPADSGACRSRIP
jgi:hypothetical protein